MEALILAIIIAYAIKKAAESSHEHWQASKAANRKASKGKPVRKRAASAVQHDAGYWLHQSLNGFPQLRNGLAAGWHAGRTAQQQGAAARRKARTEHLERQVSLIDEVREHLRRQEKAMEKLRAARQPEPEPEQEPAQPGAPEPQQPAQVPPPRQASEPPAPGGASMTPTEGSTMFDTSYTQQMSELAAIRGDAEAEAAATGRFRSKMGGRLDELQGMGLDAATLADAAAIDDALQAQEKAALQTLDAADAAIAGLSKRHGGIKEAVDDSPVAKAAAPEFYED